MKYKTLKDLKDAYDGGELSKSDALTLDNDCTFVYQYNDYADGIKVFDGGMPEALLREALDLLGIPHEPA